MNFEMETKYIKFDGKECGIGIFDYGINEFILNPSGKIKIFKSLELARVFLAEELGIRNPLRYRRYIIINGNEIDFQYVNYIEGYYQFYSSENGKIVKYFCEETKINKVLEIGYFVFEDGDTKRCEEKQYGYKKQKQIFKAIRDVGYEIAQYMDLKPSIEKVEKVGNGEVVFHIKDSTAKLHICYNNNIMQLNQERKDDGIRCLPYDKSMDKFLTIYSYLTKDMSEPDKFEADVKGKALITMIDSYLRDFYPELTPHYTTVEFRGTITL